MQKEEMGVTQKKPLKAKICAKMWIQCHFLSGIHTVMTS